MRKPYLKSWSRVDIVHLDNSQAVSRRLSAISKQPAAFPLADPPQRDG
jgi:hypothetical protein